MFDKLHSFRILYTKNQKLFLITASSTLETTCVEDEDFEDYKKNEMDW